MASVASVACEITPLCRPSYKCTTVRKTRNQGTHPGLRLSHFRNTVPKWYFCCNGREVGKQGGRCYWPLVNGTMNFRWPSPVQQCNFRIVGIYMSLQNLFVIMCVDKLILLCEALPGVTDESKASKSVFLKFKYTLTFPKMEIH